MGRPGKSVGVPAELKSTELCAPQSITASGTPGLSKLMHQHPSCLLGVTDSPAVYRVSWPGLDRGLLFSPERRDRLRDTSPTLTLSLLYPLRRVPLAHYHPISQREKRSLHGLSATALDSQLQRLIFTQTAPSLGRGEICRQGTGLSPDGISLLLLCPQFCLPCPILVTLFYSARSQVRLGVALDEGQKQTRQVYQPAVAL